MHVLVREKRAFCLSHAVTSVKRSMEGPVFVSVYAPRFWLRQTGPLVLSVIKHKVRNNRLSGFSSFLAGPFLGPTPFRFFAAAS